MTSPTAAVKLLAGLVKGTLTPAEGHRLNVSYLINDDEFETARPQARYGNEVQGGNACRKI